MIAEKRNTKEVQRVRAGRDGKGQSLKASFIAVNRTRGSL